MGLFENFPITDFYRMDLDWIIAKVKELSAEWLSFDGNWEKWVDDTDAAIIELKNYVSNYFSNLDVQEEINNKLDEMYDSGALADLIAEFASETAEVYSLSYTGQPASADNPNQYNIQDMTLIKLGNGENALIDAGFYYPDESIKLWFTSKGVEKLDHILITHYHSDHIGGLQYIASVLDTDGATAYLPQLVDPGKVSATITANEQAILTLAREHKWTIKRATYEGEQFNLTDVVIVGVYNINHSTYYNAASGTMTADEYNNCSNVYMIENMNTALLFPGDIEEAAQANIAGNLHKVNIAYMSHHGKNYTIADDYFYSIYPDVYMVQNGNGNTIGTSSISDYIAKESRENLIAQRHNIPVYAASENDYGLYFKFNAFSFEIFNKAYPDSRIGSHNWSVNDITQTTGTLSQAADVTELYKEIPANSKSVFLTSSAYKSTPHFNGTRLSSGNKTYSNTLQIHSKTDSFAYVGSGAPREAGVSAFVRNTQPTGDIILLHRYYANDAAAEAGTLTQNIINLSGVEYFSVVKDLDAAIAITLISFDESDRALYWGEDCFINNDGLIEFNNRGVYEVDLEFWTKTRTAGAAMYGEVRLDADGAIYAGFNQDVVSGNTNRNFALAKTILNVSAGQTLRVSYMYPNTCHMNVYVKRLSRENGVTLEDFITHK